jgi:CRP-like cAMP-binding protein/Fe-S-cluster-containing hydrogenase component 2
MAELLHQPPIAVTIDGVKVQVPRVSVSLDPKGKAVPRLTTIYDAAVKAKVQIPILCHREYMNPVAVCRVCSVQVGFEDGRREWRLAPACYRPVEAGMVVETDQKNQKVRSTVKMLTELLLADHPSPCEKQRRYGDCELEVLADRLGIEECRFPRAPERRPHDSSSLVIEVDHNACILCDRCVRGCNDIRDNQVIGRMGKGYHAQIAFDLNTPMGDSSCVACGECMVSCPTGALVNRGFVGPEPWGNEKTRPEPVPTDELAELPLFQGVSKPFLHWNEGAVVRRHFKKGDIICKEGDFGSSAFYIEQGSVNIYISAPMKHVKTGKGKGEKKDWGLFGLSRKFKTGLAETKEDPRPEAQTMATMFFIHIDAPVPLAFGNPTATLKAGDLFGEMTCMSFYPRSATVQARENCVVLEMLRNVLYILQRSKQSRALLDEKYRRNAIDSHLRSVLIFSELIKDEYLFSKFVNFLRDRVELIRLNPGDVIFRQGDVADAFYLVRIGFVKVTQRQPGGEHVLNYVGPGRYFGEIGLMSHIPEIRALAPAGRRVATCAALDHVDLVRIKAEDFRHVLKEFPQVKDQLIRVAVEHLEENEQTRRRVEGVPLEDFLNQGLMNAQSLLVLDLERCTRCDECTKACADAHDGITRLIREGLRFDKYLVTTSCRSCLDPYCMVGCPVGSIRRRNSREIIIEDWCIGCGKCAENCPYGNINMHPFEELRPDPQNPGRKIAVVQQKATTCDLCSDLDGQPSCVYACPHDAAFRMPGKELLRRVQGDALVELPKAAPEQAGD